MSDECEQTIDLDFSENYWLEYRDNPELDTYLFDIEDQPWEDAEYTGMNTWGKHLFSRPDEGPLEEFGIWSCPLSKGVLVRARNHPIEFIVDSVRAVKVFGVDANKSGKHWLWQVKFKRIRV